MALRSPARKGTLMCAGYPGGKAVSRMTGYANLKGIKGEVARLPAACCNSRAVISTSGGQWVLRAPTGRQQILADLEHLADALATGGVIDWNRLHELTGIPVANEVNGRVRASPPDGRYQLIRSVPLHGELPQMTAAEFTVALLAHASNHESRSPAPVLPLPGGPGPGPATLPPSTTGSSATSRQGPA